VEQGLAACVNLVPGLRSIYRWKGEILDEPETLLVIKTTAEHVAAVAASMPELHPYEVPELLALAPTEGLAPYLAWLGQAVASSTPDN
jgi:periplasmic divalent cation tolerance protein